MPALWRPMPVAITACRPASSTGLTHRSRSGRSPSISMHSILKPRNRCKPRATATAARMGAEHQPPQRKAPKVISPSDPASAWTAKANKRVQFGYGLNYLIDVEHAVIVDVEATPARTFDEVAATPVMIDRTERTFALKPKR